MTSETKKLRALFLAALMVVSVFGAAVAFSGAAAAANVTDDSNYEDRDDKLVSGQTFWQGQDLYLGNDSGTIDSSDSLELHPVTEDEDNTLPLVDQFSLNENGTYLLDTSDLETGTYVITTGNDVVEFDDQGNATNTLPESSENISTAAFDLATQSFSAEFQDSSGDPVEEVEDGGDGATEYINFDSNRDTFSVLVTADGLSDEEDFQQIFNETGNWETAWDDDDEELTLYEVQDDDYPVNFTDIDTDEYEFTFEVSDTGVTDTDTVSVVEEGEGSVDLAPSSIDVAQGDVAEITLELSDTSTGTLVIGNADDDGYQYNVSVEDDGDDQVTVYFNTYLAGSNVSGTTAADEIVWVDQSEEDDEITHQEEYEGPDSILDTGSYELAVLTGAENYEDATDTPDNIGSLYLEERSTDAVSTWTMSHSNAGDVETFEEFQTALDNDQVTESSTIAAGELVDSTSGDKLVTHVSASGLEGLMQTAEGDVSEGVVNTFDDSDKLTPYNESDAAAFPGDATDGYSLTLEEVDPGANQDPVEVDLSGVTIDTVYTDGEGNYYVVADASSIISASNDEIEDGDEYELSFDLKDERLLDYNEDDDWADNDIDNWETVTASVTFEEPDVSFDVEEIEDSDYVTVNAESGQTITGSTNAAPGTELNIRATGEDEARFVKDVDEIVVQTDGTFSAEFDFSDRAVDEEFTVRATGGVLNALESGDQEADGMIVEAVEEPTPTTTTTPEPTTTTTTTTTEQPATPTPTEVPPTTTTTTTETPGFGIAVAILALIGAALVALRRRN